MGELNIKADAATQPGIGRSLLIYYVYFLLLSTVPQLVFWISGIASGTGVRQSILMCSLWLVPLVILPRQSRLLAQVLGSLIAVGSLLSLSYWLIYQQEFSQSALYVSFESNLAESGEFIVSYLNWKIALLWLGVGLLMPGLWRLLPRSLPFNNTRHLHITALLAGLIVSWPFVSEKFVKHRSLQASIDKQINSMAPASPWNLIFSYVNYCKTLDDIQARLAENKLLPDISGLTANGLQSPQTIVLVLGESTARNRMSLYGYGRPTTPELDKLKPELIAFNNAISPRPYTIEALREVLTFANQSTPEAGWNEQNLVNLMRQAGYQTTWITNQQTQSKRNTMLTMLSELADKAIFLNNNRTQNGASQYDEVVLEPFQQALKRGAQKQFIIVHLLGTHRDFKNRYPKTFEHFANNDQYTEQLNEQERTTYNQYDNAMRYNDYVVAQLIKTLKQYGQSDTALVFLSDHGEEVYDYPAIRHFAGRNEQSPSPAMFEVPLIVWANDSFTQKRPFAQWQNFADRPQSTDNFIYLFSTLVGLSYDDMQSSLSALSEEFTPSPRTIGNPEEPNTLINYDVLEEAWRLPNVEPEEHSAAL